MLVTQADSRHLARIQRQVAALECRQIPFEGRARVGEGAVGSQARQHRVEGRHVVVHGGLDALVLGRAEVGPAHIVADVLQFLVEIDVEQRDFTAPGTIVVAGAHFVGLRLLRLQAVGGLIADTALTELEVLQAAE
ncbi:hypothetical protein D9M72_521560 [compost metagenome]